MTIDAAALVAIILRERGWEAVETADDVDRPRLTI